MILARTLGMGASCLGRSFAISRLVVPIKNKLYGFCQQKRIVDANGLKSNLHIFKSVDHVDQWSAPFMRHMLKSLIKSRSGVHVTPWGALQP